MDASELATQIAQVDRMIDRVVKVIGRERTKKPLRADFSYPAPKVAKQTPKDAKLFRVSPLRGSTGYSQAIASGSLTGNEMRISSARPRESDDDPTGMWAAFEADFDDMVAGMH